MMMGALLGLSLALAFVAGFFARDWMMTPSALAFNSADAAQEAGYPLLDEVQALLDQVYLRDQPTYIERQYAAIRGLLQGLDDQYTYFIEPPVAQSEAHVFAGTYGGIGVLLKRLETGEFGLFPFPDEPAAEAGIEDGDVLLAIDGAEIDLSAQQDAVDQMMRGEVGDGKGVELTVRQRDGATLTTFIEFAVINVPSVVWRVLAEDERVGYIQLLRFTNRTPGEVETAVTELRDAGVMALVLDLRDNSGGLLDESITVADHFLDGGVIAYEVSQDAEEAFRGTSGGVATDWPLVVLVNGGTASASELVAGALRDRDRAVLIGQRTFGKGTVQQIFSLSDGSSVHITSSEWFTPERTPLDGTGLEPTIPMIPAEDGRDVELGEALRTLQTTLREAEPS